MAAKCDANPQYGNPCHLHFAMIHQYNPTPRKERAEDAPRRWHCSPLRRMSRNRRSTDRMRTSISVSFANNSRISDGRNTRRNIPQNLLLLPVRASAPAFLACQKSPCVPKFTFGTAIAPRNCRDIFQMQEHHVAFVFAKLLELRLIFSSASSVLSLRLMT